MCKLAQPRRDLGGPWSLARGALTSVLEDPDFRVSGPCVSPVSPSLCPLSEKQRTWKVGHQEQPLKAGKSRELFHRWARSPWPARSRTTESGKAWGQEDRKGCYFPFCPGEKFLQALAGVIREAPTRQSLRPADPDDPSDGRAPPPSTGRWSVWS